ncbi:hypothetical protein M231_07880 [Tremella mesenterica]|uniref:BHLH domain-containing protein n=2 Tax=Tremella mesenterica TaxID=5217 RepID=A0A4Q1B8B1_TREME|nr:hypothetical protein M231_07880 [Tremella mesenterica]
MTDPNGQHALASHDRLVTDPAFSSVRSSADDQDGSVMKFDDSALETLNAAVEQGADPFKYVTAGESSTGLKASDGKPSGSQPFARTPELRVSHKIAERKRRKEMKELFDELRDLLPSERGSKSSKWEILSKAIDHVTNMKNHNAELIREIERTRRELDMARGGNGQFAPYHTAPYAIPQAPLYPGIAAYPTPAAVSSAPATGAPPTPGIPIGTPTSGSIPTGRQQSPQVSQHTAAQQQQTLKSSPSQPGSSSSQPRLSL